jgi:hypothetical protein
MVCSETHVTHSVAEMTAFRPQFHVRKQTLLERSAAAAQPLLFWQFGVPSRCCRFVHRPKQAARLMSVSNGRTSVPLNLYEMESALERNLSFNKNFQGLELRVWAG